MFKSFVTDDINAVLPLSPDKINLRVEWFSYYMFCHNKKISRETFLISDFKVKAYSTENDWI